MFKQLFCTTFLLSMALTNSVLAKETIKVDREFGLERVIKIDVTPSGIALDLGAQVNSVKLTQLGDISVVGIDGEICLVRTRTECNAESLPTKLLLQKISTIDFKDQLPTIDGTTMLFVNTTSGLYRFEITPDDNKPEYTEVEIINDPIEPLLEGQKR